MNLSIKKAVCFAWSAFRLIFFFHFNYCNTFRFKIWLRSVSEQMKCHLYIKEYNLSQRKKLPNFYLWTMTFPTQPYIERFPNLFLSSKHVYLHSIHRTQIKWLHTRIQPKYFLFEFPIDFFFGLISSSFFYLFDSIIVIIAVT